MIAVVDYGMGNLRSVQKGLERVGQDAVITSNPDIIKKASALVLPGVGAFGACMNNLQSYRLVDVVLSSIKKGKPFLGICVGMQLLFSECEEFGKSLGLDILKGKVVRFPQTVNGARLKIPHMGWNNIKFKKNSPFFKGLPDNSFVYFVHSYHPIPEDKDIIATTTKYGIEFTSSVYKDNIFATQFHPEKSQTTGLNILRNFGELI
ncbi:MAG TPA: imidazole glycerol phosphate synthase subunit HisH [Nitrospinota bacterium]|nr:imidazole glycerol phosphate synthase subunit HisH [Nitrospinota bacterium]